MTDRLWPPLISELAAWRDIGRRAPVWWRDDDATTPSDALDRLLALSAEKGIPMGLAVIPQGATPALAARLGSLPAVRVLVHGWAHRNHEPAGVKKSEFGAHRPADQRREDARRGLKRLRELFGDQCAPVFVPPWNRFSPDVDADLMDLGYTTLSAFGPTPEDTVIPRMNTHLDLIDWRGSRSIPPPDRVIDQLTRLLRERRQGSVDGDAPLGILTHHIVHDDAVWDFLAPLLHHLETSEAVRWVTPEGSQ